MRQLHTCCADGSAIQLGSSGSGMASSEPPAATAGGSAFGFLACLWLRSSAGGSRASLAACLACIGGQRMSAWLHVLDPAVCRTSPTGHNLEMDTACISDNSHKRLDCQLCHLLKAGHQS